MEVEEKTYTEKEYRKAEGINYSKLSAVDRDPKSVNRESSETDAMLKGSIVDCLLTGGDFHAEYYVMTTVKPKSEQMIAYVESMVRSGNHEVAQIESGYKQKVSEAKWEKEGRFYYDALIASEGKTVISWEMNTECTAVVKALKENEFTGKYFNNMAPEDVEIKDQLIIFFTVMGKKCKAMLDKVVVSHGARKIYPIDLKTTGKSVKQFKASFVFWRYYIQAAFYTEAVTQWAAEYYPEYTVEPFEFIVAEMANYNPPMIYTVSEQDLLVGRFGGEDFYGNPIKGYEQLMNDLQWHTKNDQWDYTRDVYMNNGRTTLDVFAK
jgi:hypothetical protein